MIKLKEYNYSTYAKYYDLIELDLEEVDRLNELLDKKLKKFKVKTLLDMTCGTGAQVIGLLKKRYKITASDLNKEMLNIAKKKTKKIKFYQRDVRYLKLGKFDAVITMFNAIGHLNKNEFEQALQNIKENLNENGIYIFDIFNLDFMKDKFRDYEYIDRLKEINGLKFVRLNNNKLDKNNGIMHINQKTWIQKGVFKPKVICENWDMQIYSQEELKERLERNGFEIIEFLDRSGEKFDKKNSLFIFAIVRKK